MSNPRGLTTDAMILAAGLGTRLRPLTNLLPKPLVPIGDAPAIAHLVAHLASAGFDRVVVNAHHLGGAIASLADADPRIVVSVERELLGTAGGLRFARDAGLLRGDRLVVVNGDIFGSLPLDELASAPCEGDAVLLVSSEVEGEGNVGVDAEGRVVRLRKEVFRAGEVRRFDYLGSALLAGRALDALPERGCLVGDLLSPCLRAGATVRVLSFGGSWVDVGTLDAYLVANQRWLDARRLDSFVAEGALVDARAQVVRSVVLGRSIVAEGTRLERCVVWPGARVERGTYADTVFLPGDPRSMAAALPVVRA